MQNRIAIVVTNRNEYAGKGRATGLWLSELVHFWNILEPAGFAFDLLSPQGGTSPLEPKSLKGATFDRETRERFGDEDFMARLEKTMPASQASWERYDAVYYTGGHGVMYDFADDEGLHALNRNLLENGRVVAAVCHGYCALLNTKLSNGRFLIEGKTMTGFTWLEERLTGVANLVPYNAERIAKERKSNFRKGLIPFMPHVEVDGRLITGQNPLSARKTAQKTLEALGKRAAD